MNHGAVAHRLEQAAHNHLVDGSIPSSPTIEIMLEKKNSSTSSFCYYVSMYPSTIYRVVAKALITDENDRILVVKEKQDFWSLPGGGLEHGETAQDCLKREIQEEIGISDVQINEIVYSTNVYLDQRDIWMTWIVYKAQVSPSDFVFGDGVTDAKYIDIKEIQNSTDLLEKLIVETVRAVK